MSQDEITPIRGYVRTVRTAAVAALIQKAICSPAEYDIGGSTTSMTAGKETLQKKKKNETDPPRGS